MIKTEYVCDKCKAVVKKEELLNIDIVVRYTTVRLQNVVYNEATTQWCIACTKKAGITKWQRNTVDIPKITSSVENQLRDLLLTVLPEIDEIKKEIKE